MSTKLEEMVQELIDAIDPFAENPKHLDNASCHIHLTDKYNCGRCSRAIKAWEVKKAAKVMLGVHHGNNG